MCDVFARACRWPDAGDRKNVLFEPVRRRSVAVLVAALVAFGVTGPANAADEPYRLQPGDTLAVGVAGLQELSTTSRIELDGALAVPLAGRVDVAGLTISEAARRVAGAISRRPFRQRVPDGREVPVAISPDEVMVSVSEYRPIYVEGLVARPGRQDYEPGMTVRQALSVAGGYEPGLETGVDPVREAVQLSGSYDVLEDRYFRLVAQRDRLLAEIEEESAIEPRDTALAAEPAYRASLGVEMQRLTANIVALNEERGFLQRARDQAMRRADVLSEQLAAEEGGSEADRNELERLSGLADRGLVPVTKVADARRQQLLAATRALETSSELELMRQAILRFEHDLAALDEEHEAERLEELAKLELDIGETQKRMQSVMKSLYQTGMMSIEMLRTLGARERLSITRRVGEDTVTLDPVGLDERLRPGDVLQVNVSASSAASEETVGMR
jgi:polysaccharide export outer membrane protein